MTQNFQLDFLIPQYIGHDSKGGHDILYPQLEHRVNLVKNIWKIPAGSKILEIGSGQGDCTLVLAAAVGDEGRVDGVDPCSLDYGSPWTVGDAQDHLKRGTLGKRMNFISADPTEYLNSTNEMYDYIVLNNCFWYFDSPQRISDLLTILVSKKHAKHILIAEWALEARNAQQVPHVLAALARGNLEYLNPKSTQNIRSPVSPAWFRNWFEEHSIKIEHEELVAPPDSMADGKWETQTVLGKAFVERIAKHTQSEKHTVALSSMRDAVVNAVAQLENGVKDVQCMMIWAVSV